jgi:hypothetical protein
MIMQEEGMRLGGRLRQTSPLVDACCAALPASARVRTICAVMAPRLTALSPPLHEHAS